MISSCRINILRASKSLARSQNHSLGTRATSVGRLASTLAILEHRDGKLDIGSTKAVAAGQHFGGEITGLVVGKNVKGVADEATRIEGLNRVLMIETSSAAGKPLPEHQASLVAVAVKKGSFTHVIASHSAFGKDVIPRAAALLGCQPISDITSVQSEDVFVRPMYAGNIIATVQSTDPVKFITVRNTSFPAAEMGGCNADLEEGMDHDTERLTELVSEELVKSDRPELATAARVVSGGRGLKSKADFDRILNPLADVLGAAIGASRAAVDGGLADNSLQIGQTGNKVAPQLYLSVGISGAIQHLAGMKDSKVIAAINNDPDAPIFQVADIGLVGDLFERVPELVEQLKSSEGKLD